MIDREAPAPARSARPRRGPCAPPAPAAPRRPAARHPPPPGPPCQVRPRRRRQSAAPPRRGIVTGKPMRIIGWGASDVGRKRNHNEDSFLCNNELALYAVADGMGGHLGR